MMRKDGNITLSDHEFDKILDKLIKLFQYLNDKDKFVEYYHKQLAKRLLTNRSKSDYNEKQFISQLKIRCGSQFTSKLEGMIKDIMISTNEYESKFLKNIKIN